MSIIKPCDIRGRYPDELDDATARALGRAIGARIADEQIVVGGDLRVHTPALKSQLIEGLLESGVHVVDIGTVPTPAFYFARHEMQIHNGIMVTASHNPAVYNGFKITLGERPIEEQQLQDIAKDMGAGVFHPRPRGGLIQDFILEKYRDRLLSAFGKELPEIARLFPSVNAQDETQKAAVVIDCGNGCNALLAADVFRAAGFEVHELFCEPDGSFPNREPNPAIPSNLKQLQKTVPAVGALLGIAFDGDGDRVAFVGPNGDYIEIDRSIAIFSRYFALRQTGARIVYDIKCSSVVPEQITSFGGVPVMERSGHTYMRATVLREGAAFGGELSGHCFFGTFGWDDSLFAGLIFATIIERTQGQILQEIPRYETTPDLRIPYSHDDKHELLDTLALYHTQKGSFTISRLDGVRGDSEVGWALARVSVTEPLFTFRFEGKTSVDLERVIRSFLSPVPKLLELVSTYRTSGRPC